MDGITNSLENTTISTKPLNPISRTILQGVYDQGSTLSMLHGVPHILQIIWKMIKKSLEKQIQIPDKDEMYERVFPEPPERIGTLGFLCIEKIVFPKPSDININMMPFIAAGRNWKVTMEQCCLPEFVKGYWDIILSVLDCALFYDPSQEGNVFYLTIQESFVEEQTSQRRPGIHTETPAIVYVQQEEKDILEKEMCKEGSGSTTIVPVPVWWGKGGYSGEYNFKGGIYMASSVPDSCAIWNCRIVKDKEGKEIIGKLGNIEHLREFLPKKKVLEKDYIYWLTDRTPHESIPLKKGTYRQFFRIVTKDVSIWYEDHSTKNPNGIVPDPSITKVVRGSKFDDENCVVIVG